MVYCDWVIGGSSTSVVITHHGLCECPVASGLCWPVPGLLNQLFLPRWFFPQTGALAEEIFEISKAKLRVSIF